MEIKLLNIDYKIEHLYNLPWIVSDIGKEGKRLVDINYRRSIQSTCEIPQTNQEHRYGAPTCWKVLKYQNGYFKEHVDHQVHPNHIGVEILLPPKVQCSYEGGQLVIHGKEKKIIFPDQNKWTLVYLPLGTRHEVTPVIGVRISFVRVVYGKNEFKYDLQKEGISAIAVTN